MNVRDDAIALPDSGWLLTGKAPFRLSIRNADRDTARTMMQLLGQALEARPSDVYAPLSRLIFEKRVVVDQVEQYFRENGPKYRQELRRITSGAGGEAGIDAQRAALRVLDVWLPEEPWALLGEPETLSDVDLETIARCGHDALQVCVRGRYAPTEVEGMSPDDQRVSAFARLVAEGLAEGYSSIPPRDLLPALRMDELRGMLKRAGGPAVRKKADAVAFIQDRDDIGQLLQATGCNRHFYRLRSVETGLRGADLEKIGRELERAWETAKLLTDSFTSSILSSRLIESNKSMGIVKAVELMPVEDDALCPCCKRMAKKKRLALGDPMPPFHLGCRCGTVEIL